MPKSKVKSSTANYADASHEDNEADATGVLGDKAEIIEAIMGLKTELKSELGEINVKLDNMATGLQSLSERVETAESRIAGVESSAQDIADILADFQRQQSSLQRQVSDLESRSRRNNIRIFGVAEGEEGNSVLKFMEDFLKETLPLPDDLDLGIQRAHRTLGPKPKPDATPRALVVNFQEFKTKELVLREAWKKGKVQLKNRVVYFDHDYASEVIKKRKEYNRMKKALKERGIRFQTPMTSIRIHWESGVRTYSNSREAWSELRRRGIPVDGPEPTEGESDPVERLREKLGSWQRATGREAPTRALSVKERLQEFRREPAVTT